MAGSSPSPSRGTLVPPASRSTELAGPPGAPAQALSTLRVGPTSTGPSPRLRLVALEGPAVGRAWFIEGFPIEIGRDDGCAVRIDDEAVSRRHCRLRHALDEVRVEDLGSQEGTHVNERLVRGEAPLVPGDRLLVGRTLLRVEEPEAHAAPPDAAGSSGPSLSQIDMELVDASLARSVAGDAEATSAGRGRMVLAALFVLLSGGVGLSLALLAPVDRPEPPADPFAAMAPLLQRGRFEEASRALEAVAEAAPDHPWLPELRGWVERERRWLRRLGRAEAALKEQAFSAARAHLAAIPASSAVASAARELDAAIDRSESLALRLTEADASTPGRPRAGPGALRAAVALDPAARDARLALLVGQPPLPAVDRGRWSPALRRRLERLGRDDPSVLPPLARRAPPDVRARARWLRRLLGGAATDDAAQRWGAASAILWELGLEGTPLAVRIDRAFGEALVAGARAALGAGAFARARRMTRAAAAWPGSDRRAVRAMQDSLSRLAWARVFEAAAVRDRDPARAARAADEVVALTGLAPPSPIRPGSGSAPAPTPR
mgnify:FL=1